jgi:hypothetical protein
MARVIPIRLSEAAWTRYAMLASQSEKPLSTYLRDRLEQEDAVLTEMSQLREGVEALLIEFTAAPAERESAPPPALRESPQAPDAATLEMLLLLRSVVPGEKQHAIEKELARIGVQRTVLGGQL